MLGVFLWQKVINTLLKLTFVISNANVLSVILQNVCFS